MTRCCAQMRELYALALLTGELPGMELVHLAAACAAAPEGCTRAEHAAAMALLEHVMPFRSMLSRAIYQAPLTGWWGGPQQASCLPACQAPARSPRAPLEQAHC